MVQPGFDSRPVRLKSPHSEHAAKGLAEGFGFLWDFVIICSTSRKWEASHQRVDTQTEGQQTLETQRAVESFLGRGGWEGFKAG